MYVPHFRFIRVRCPNNAEMARFLRLTHLGTIAQPFFLILNFTVLQLLSNRNKLKLFMFHLLLLFFSVCLVPSTSMCRGLLIVWRIWSSSTLHATTYKIHRIWACHVTAVTSPLSPYAPESFYHHDLIFTWATAFSCRKVVKTTWYYIYGW